MNEAPRVEVVSHGEEDRRHPDEKADLARKRIANEAHACDGRNEQRRRRDEHQTFVDFGLAPIIDSSAEEKREHDHVAQRRENESLCFREVARVDTRLELTECGEHADGDERDPVVDADAAQSPVLRDAAGGDEYDLRDEQQNPARVDGGMDMDDGWLLDDTAEERTEIGRPETDERDRCDEQAEADIEPV